MRDLQPGVPARGGRRVLALDGDRPARPRRQRHHGLDLLEALVAQHLARSVAHDLVARPAEQAGDPVVGVGVDALRVLHRDVARKGVEQRTQLRFAVVQRLLRLEIRRHVGVGAHQAAVGQVPGLHFDAPPGARLAHIEQRQVEVFHRLDELARLGRDVGQAFAEVATFVLEGGDLGQRGAGLDQRLGQVEQFEHAPVVHADPAFGVHADDALRDAVERDLQGMGLLRQLGAGRAQLGLGALARADVGEHADRTDPAPGGVEDRRGVVEAVDLAAVGARQGDLVTRGDAGGAILDLLAKDRGVGGVDEVVEAPADDVFAGAAEDPAHRRVHVGRDAFGVDEPEALVRGLHQQRQQVVLFGQCQFGRLGFGDVLHHAVDAHHLAVFELRPPDHADPALAASQGGERVGLVVGAGVRHHGGQPGAHGRLLLGRVQARRSPSKVGRLEGGASWIR